MTDDFQGGRGFKQVAEASVLPSGQVTFLFTDIEGSTRLALMLGDDYRAMLNEHRAVLRTALTEAGGAELFTEGDSYFFAFSDAGRAVLACAAAQRALASHDWAQLESIPRVRMGLHTGEAYPYAGEYASAEVHRASRVATAAHGCQILLSASTAAAVESILPDRSWLLDLGLHRLRGFDGRERLFQLVAPALERHFPHPRTDGCAPHNLPHPVTSFIGRTKERRELRGLLQTHRLVTVVGAGGAGKTRLATTLASDLADSFPDGVWYLDLATVTDPALVTGCVGTILGLRPEPGRPFEDTVVEHIAGKRILLLLDTCEAQLGAAASLIGRLLRGTPFLRVLATSREPLGNAGEVVWRIPALCLESGAGSTVSDAVALLADRTTAARGGSEVDPDELAHLAVIASRLDGLPLALELAAARLRVLSAGELAARLCTELGLSNVDTLKTLDAGTDEDGGGSRHTTMNATVGWSYRTLPADAARLLRWLSVFAGPVEFSTVEWHMGEDPLAALTVLVDKSLVQVEQRSGRIFYRMLHPIRGYAARMLARTGEENAARDRHVAWTLRALHRAQHGPDGQQVTLSLYAIDPLAVELRAALQWSSSGGQARPGLRIASSVDQWWRERGLAREGRLWMFRLYARVNETAEHLPDAEQAVAYQAHSTFACADGEPAEQLRFSRKAESAARRCGDPGLLARVLSGRAGALRDAGHVVEAERLCREVIEWAEQHDVAPDALIAICNLAELLWLRDSLDEAASLLAAARQMEQARPGERGRRTVDLLLGMVALGRGDLVAAHDHLTVALRSRMAYGFHGRTCVAIKAIATRCVLGGDAVTGAVLFGAAESTTAKLHCGPGVFGPYWQKQQESARAVIGDVAFDEAYARGARLTLADAAKFASGVEHPDLVGDQHGIAIMLRR